VIDLFLVILKPALLYADGKQWRYLPIALVAWVLDMVIAHTTWALMFGWPKKREWTISDTLERMCWEWNNPDRDFHVALALKINRLSPTKNHIRAVL